MQQGKWTARDLQLPHEPYFTNIKNGDIALLERMLAQHEMSVVVYYAPWSRPSHRRVGGGGSAEVVKMSHIFWG